MFVDEALDDLIAKVPDADTAALRPAREVRHAVHAFIANTAPPSLLPRPGSPLAVPSG